jgi:hypothetical protein
VSPLEGALIADCERRIAEFDKLIEQAETPEKK